MEKDDDGEIGIYEIRKPLDILGPLIHAARNLDAGGRKGGISELARRLNMPRSNLYPILRRENNERADILLSTALRIADALGYKLWFSQPPEKADPE
jgi:DNA-binding phage protein